MNRVTPKLRNFAERLIAREMRRNAASVEDAGGKVVGPAASCKEALAFLAAGIVSAAILDVNLVDGDCSPLVDALVGREVPFIVHTAVEVPPDLSTRFSGLVVWIKPCPAASLVAQLEILLAEGAARPKLAAL